MLHQNLYNEFASTALRSHSSASTAVRSHTKSQLLGH